MIKKIDFVKYVSDFRKCRELISIQVLIITYVSFWALIWVDSWSNDFLSLAKCLFAVLRHTPIITFQKCRKLIFEMLFIEGIVCCTLNLRKRWPRNWGPSQMVVHYQTFFKGIYNVSTWEIIFLVILLRIPLWCQLKRRILSISFV